VAVFDAQAQQYEQPDFNGCAFIAASTEAPSGGLVEHAADHECDGLHWPHCDGLKWPHLGWLVWGL
jgi:hypothetical protein